MAMETMNVIVDARIEEPTQVGKYCHQCRQKKSDVVGTCVTKIGTRPCSVKYCPKCLWKRYEELAEAIESKDDWVCHKCRMICNCSVCMKKKGKRPIGVLPRTAKEDAVGQENSAEELNDSSPACMEEKESTDSITSSERSSSLHKNLVSSKDAILDVESSRYVAHSDRIQHPQVMRRYKPSGCLKVNGQNVSLRSYGYKKPSGFLKVKGENVAVTALKRQLGRQYREDGPPLGLEFDPLPLAFARNDVIQNPQVMRSDGSYKPSGYLKVKGENVATTTTLKSQLGRQFREDGPPLGVECDPLPPLAFEPQSNVIVQGDQS